MIADQRCFHCNAPLEPRSTVRGDSPANPAHTRLFCCVGCQAATEIIERTGLADYYRTRTQYGAAPVTEPSTTYRHYDRTDVLQNLAIFNPNGDVDVFLLLENIRCSACAWLIEERLKSQPGVSLIQVNLATGQARLVFNPKAMRLSALLDRIAELGYRPHLIGNVDQQHIQKREQRILLKRLVVAGMGMMQIMMIAIGLYFSRRSGMDPVITDYLRLTCMVVSAPVIFYSGRTFFEGAWLGLRAGTIGMDTSVTLGVLLAFGLSAFNALRHQGEIYFESALMFIFFLLLSRLIEMRSRHQAGSMASALAQLLPAHATRLRGAITERVALSALVPDDRVVVSAPEIVPADGLVESGDALVNESWLTGESHLIAKAPADAVLGGSLLHSGSLTLRVTQTGSNTMIAQIVRLLLRAQADRPRSVWIADRWAKYFVSAVLLATVVVGCAWAVIDPSRCVDAIIAVLVISCPCAFSLATPVAVAVATQFLAKQGIFVTSGDALNSLTHIDTVLFDKTGTLTVGEPCLRSTQLFDSSLQSDQCLEIASALERGHNHPLQQAFNHPTHLTAHDVQVFPGLGIEGRIDQTLYRLGQRHFVLAEPQSAHAPSTTDAANVYLARNGVLCAQFVIEDRIRTGMRALIESLQAQGLRVILLSGDHLQSVESTARELGIREFQARLSPADKLATLHALRQQGHRVLAVGDGINDAPLLQAADTSMAIASGATLTQAAAELIQRPESLSDLAHTLQYAKRMRAIIRQNLVWSLWYNAAAIPLAALALIPPWLAAIGMTLSSLGVTLNALRLRLYSPTTQHRVAAP